MISNTYSASGTAQAYERAGRTPMRSEGKALIVWSLTAVFMSIAAYGAIQTGPWAYLGNTENTSLFVQQAEISDKVRMMESELSQIKVGTNDLRINVAGLEEKQVVNERWQNFQENRIDEALSLSQQMALNTTETDNLATGSVSKSASASTKERSETENATTDELVRKDDHAEIKIRSLMPEDVQTLENTNISSLEGQHAIPAPNLRPNDINERLANAGESNDQLTTASIRKVGGAEITQSLQAANTQGEISNEQTIVSQSLFGIELGASDSISGLHSQWKQVLDTSHGLAKDLRPHMQLNATTSNGESVLKLIAGPFSNVAQAMARCTELKSIGLNCQAVKLTGSSPIKM